MEYFKLPKNTARLIVLQRIELTSPFLRKLRKLFGRYVFSSFITKYFLNPRYIGKEYYRVMLKEFLSIEQFINQNKDFCIVHPTKQRYSDQEGYEIHRESGIRIMPFLEESLGGTEGFFIAYLHLKGKSF